MFKVKEFIGWNEITGAGIWIVHPETYATKAGASAGIDRIVNRYTSKGVTPKGFEVIPFIVNL